MRSKRVELPSLILMAAIAAGCSPSSEPSVENRPIQARPESPPVKGDIDFVIQAHGSSVEFTGSKLTGSHEGGFRGLTGRFTVKDGRLVGADQIIDIAMASVYTDNPRLTRHLIGPQFFDVERFPVSRFVSTAIKATDSGYLIAGRLTLHGVTRPIRFPAKIDINARQMTVQSEFHFNRKDFGIRYPGNPDDLIRNEVAIRLDVLAKPETARQRKSSDTSSPADQGPLAPAG